MTLNVSQSFEIEQLLTNGRKIDAIKVYREATGDDLKAAKQAVEAIDRQLKQDRPWLFEKGHSSGTGSSASESSVSDLSNGQTVRKAKRTGILLFIIVDTIIFALIFYWFFVQDGAFFDDVLSFEPAVTAPPAVQSVNPSPNQLPKSSGGESIQQPTQPAQTPLPKFTTANSISLAAEADRVPLPEINVDDFQAALSPAESFASLYASKVADIDYIARKNNSGQSKTYDNSLLERKIKSVRSQLVKQRVVPSGVTPIPIPVSTLPVSVNGKVTRQEWQDGLSVKISNDFDTTIFLKSDGQWLYIACDARDETTEKGFDQFRVYLHAGLTAEMDNERIHLGRGDRVTSIRQTNVFYQGEPSERKNERWKKYAISDWGLYKYVLGKSAMHGNRHYEVAISVQEAGLFVNVPFTLYAVVETDPQRNEAGKFQARRYLGKLGSEKNPQWFVIAKPE